MNLLSFQCLPADRQRPPVEGGGSAEVLRLDVSEGVRASPDCRHRGAATRMRINMTRNLRISPNGLSQTNV
ncbi:hypothetical protein NQZ68_021727 [Dissostichus eleginoides]|nr:hypothetical protein NQZ68_021727 [Dissostichus eleginoides]